jgi:deazaflavin-dependent oxidoreductase (nitroreductase family)
MSVSNLQDNEVDRAATCREAAAREASKHGRLLKSARDGKILSAIMLPFYAIATPPGHAVLTTIGRKTGKQRRKCIRAIRRGDQAYAVMMRPPVLAIERPTAVAAWLLNIRANPNVQLKLGRRSYRGVAREITDPAELDIAREATCDTVHLVDYGEADLHLRGLPSRAKIRDLHRYWFETGIPIVIDLTDAKD